MPHDRSVAGLSSRDAWLSLVALVLAIAALDDITTDTATSFTVEYVALAICAAWFGFIAVRLLRRR